MSTPSEKIGAIKGRLKESFRFTTTRPVAILMIVIGITVFGAQSYRKLPLNLMPDISYPSLTVRTEWEGAGPEDIENNVSKRIESALAVVDNLVNIRSISKAGISDVILEFGWKTDMNAATADVREKLDQVILPNDAESPLILRYDPSLDPIMRIALYAGENVPGISQEEMARRLREHASEEIREKLEAVEGVAAVRVRGGLERELQIQLDERALKAKKVNPQDVILKIRSENINLPGGNLREGDTEYQVRVLNEFRDKETIEGLIISSQGNKNIRLKDVARVEWSHKEREIYTRVNSMPSVEIDIFKEADANIVEVAQGVRNRIFGTPAEVADAETYRQMMSGESTAAQGGRGGRGLPQRPVFLAYEIVEQDGDWTFTVLTDQSIFIRSSIDEVINNAFLGGILSIIILFLFLRSTKSTILIGLTIPVSVVATFAPMMVFGVSLNIMSLGGLALGIGMLVDSSIVVLESIFRCREEGDTLVEAVIRGTSEVGGAVFASTVTTIAVFFPIVFVEGVAGQVFGDMSLTVVFSLLASLLCALFFIPMLASRQVKISEIESRLPMSGWSFPSFAKVRDRLKGEINGEGGGERLGQAAAITPKAVWWSILALPGLFYDLLFRRGRSLQKLAERLKSFWSRNKGLFGNVVVKAVICIPHHMFFLLVFIVDLFLDILGRPFNSAVIAGRRIKTFWSRERSVLRWLPAIPFVGVPLHIYVGFVFIIHFVLELVGRIIGLLMLVLFKTVKIIIVSLGAVLGVLLWLPLRAFQVVMDALNNLYPRALSWALGHKAVVIAVALLIAVHAGTLVMSLKSDLIPEVHQGEFNVRVKVPIDKDIEFTDERTKEVENAVMAALSGSDSPYDTLATVVGTEKTENTRSDEGANTSVVTVRLADTIEMKNTELKAISRIRERLSEIPGLSAVTFDRPVLFSFKTPIELEIKGPLQNKLKEYSYMAVDELTGIEGLTDIKNSIQPGNPEQQIVFDRDRLKKFNMDISSEAQLVRNLVEGNIATVFRRKDRQYDIRVRMNREDIKNPEDLERLDLRPFDEKNIRLKEVADIETREGPNEIRRHDQERTALITANIKDTDLRTATAAISESMEKIRRENSWGSDYTYDITGQSEEMEVSTNSLQWALALAVFLVYIVMASQFESLIQPFIIIFTIPLALIGVIYMLAGTGTSVSIVVLIGVIMLAGIVVNNAIVMVDYINQLRQRGLTKIEAIIEGARIRLRPILMTTLTTVLGMLPLALGLGAGTEIRSPMAWTVIAGLSCSTLLTLMVIPTVYAAIDRKEAVSVKTEAGEVETAE